MDPVLSDVANGIATITLNRPEKLNAANFDMGEALIEALRAAEASDDVRCVVLTGAGRGFCAGDDVDGAWNDPRMAATLRSLGGVRPPLTPEVAAFLACTKPTIAAVNGVAVGIGMDFAVLCDLRVASEHAKFGQLFVKMALGADVTGYWRLPQLVGLEHATRLLLTGDVVDAAEAQRIGLVSQVVTADELLPTVYALATRIAANPPLAVRTIKEGLRRGIGRGAGDLDELAAFVGGSLARLFASEDHREAAAAFLEKRVPVFEGR